MCSNFEGFACADLQACTIQYELPELTHCGSLIGPVITDQIEIPLPGGMADLDDLHVQPQQHLHIGHHGDTEPLGHQSGDDLVLLRLIGDLRRAANLCKQPIHNTPQAGVLGEKGRLSARSTAWTLESG